MMFIPNPNLDVPVWAAALVRTGGMGVTLFFVVSAFSLCYTMPMHERERRPLLSFYVRRFFRIAPLFYVLLAFTLLRDSLAFGVTHAPATITENLLFLFNLTPGRQVGIVWASWTIGAEMIFYLFFPLFYLWAKDIYRAVAFFLVAVVVAAIFKFFLAHFSVAVDDFFTWSVVRHLPIFALGLAAFRLHERVGHREEGRRGVGVLLIATSLFLFSALIQGKLDVFFADSYYWQAPVFVALLLGISACPLRLLVNATTRFLGKVSYSLYLIHPSLIYFLTPIYRQVYEWPLPRSIRYLILVSLTFAALISLAYLTYRLIEEPGIQLGKRFARRSL
jgi:peptidoglycan/LPS O-acetylase OafA/YrhL